MEQAILRNAPAIYQRGGWAAENVENNPRLVAMLQEFRRLQGLLRNAKCKVRCSESDCKKRARWMTFEQADQGYSPFPTFWCNKHEPADYEFLSGKMHIDMEAMRNFREMKYKKVFCKQIWEAFGIRKGTRITEAYAHHFFQTLRTKQISSRTEM
jgi:hypothetical protein